MYLHGSFDWYMPDIIANFDSRAAKFFTAFSFMLATIGNQVAAGKTLYPPLDLSRRSWHLTASNTQAPTPSPTT